MTWPEVIRETRKKRNQTQEQLAVRIGTSRQQIRRWELGVHKPQVYYQEKLARWAKVSKAIFK